MVIYFKYFCFVFGESLGNEELSNSRVFGKDFRSFKFEDLILC